MTRTAFVIISILGLAAGSASGGATKSSKPADYQKFTVIAELKGFSYEVKSVTWSPDSQLLAAGGKTAEVWLWSLHNGEVVAKLNNETMGQTNRLDFSRDGKLLAAGGVGGEIKIWDVEAKKLQTSLKLDIPSEVETVLFSPDGKHLLVLSGGISLWNVANGSLEYNTPERVSAVAWSQDGKQIFEGGPLGFCVRDAASGKMVRQSGQKIEKGNQNICCVFSPDGKTAAVAPKYQNETDTAIRLYNTSSGTILRELRVPRSSPELLDYSPDGKFLVMGPVMCNVLTGANTNLRPTGQGTMSLPRSKMSPDGRFVAIALSNGAVQILGENSQTPSKTK